MKKDIMKIVYYTDVHLQGYNPPSRLGDYRGDILGKVSQVMTIAREEGADFTYCGGDLFHHKKPINTPHSLVTELVGVLSESGTDNYCVVGNHDIQSDNMDTLKEQPLGTLFKGGHLAQVTHGTVVTKGNLNVHLDSYDFDEEPEWDVITECAEEVEADVHTLGAHVYSCPKGGNLFGTKIYSYEELSVTGHDIYFLGHYHPDNGVTDGSFAKDRQTFVNPGSLSRGDYGDENLERKPNCVIVTIEKTGEDVTWTTEQRYLKVHPANLVFDLDQKKKLKVQKEETANFVVELEAASKRDEVKETEEEELAEIAPDPVIFKKTMEYINKARETLGKAVVK